MEFKNDDLGVTFALPDKITVRQHLEYKSRLGAAPGGFLLRYWEAAKTLIQEWQCEFIKLDDDIDQITDQRAADALSWAGLRVSRYLDELKALPKNS